MLALKVGQAQADRLIGMIGCFGVSNENGVALEISVS